MEHRLDGKQVTLSDLICARCGAMPPIRYATVGGQAFCHPRARSLQTCYEEEISSRLSSRVTTEEVEQAFASFSEHATNFINANKTQRKDHP